MTDQEATNVAVDFLERLRPGRSWQLTAIMPDGAIETVNATNASAVREFVRANDGKRNLYYAVNPTRTAMTSKAAKVDVAAIEYLLADLDPREDESPEEAKARYLAAIEKYAQPATAIVDSGNGIQALWRLKVPIVLPEPVTVKNAEGKPKKVLSPEAEALVGDVEARVKALMEALGSVAGTQNIDRIFRLPGTTNLPTKKKRKASRRACPTKLIRFSDATHALESFPPAPTTDRQSTSRGKSSAIDVDRLPVFQRIKNLIRGVDDPEHPYDSRSERVMAVLVAMAGADCTDEQMVAVMRAEELPIGQHVREQSDPDRYLTRQIAQARKAAADPDVAKLNEAHALVLVGDKTAVMKMSNDGIKLLTVSAFQQWFANQHVTRNNKEIPLAKYWLSHKQRRQYEGLVFAPLREVPNHFNLWRGFGVEPRAGDCSKFLAHLRDNVCRGYDTLYPWVVGWFAQIVQHPDKKMGTSLVLRGKQGTGKTKVGEVIGSLLGEHYALVSDPRYVTGRFNSHLVSCLVLHCDESFWAGDHAAEGKLKDLITGNDHFIEYKGKEPIRVRNFVRLFVTGNPDWLVPAGFEERRFAVLEVGNEHIQDKTYFAAIDAEMDTGGREALLYFLLHFDLKSVDLRTIPTTAALLDQKLSSLNPEQGWWLDMLSRGELPAGCDEVRKCPAFKLFNRYITHASKQGVRRRSIEVKLGIFLQKNVPHLLRSDELFIIRHEKIQRGYVYTFPSLAECRQAFAKTLQQDVTWPKKDEWSTAPELDPEEYF